MMNDGQKRWTMSLKTTLVYLQQKGVETISETKLRIYSKGNK
jgi:hypothetical protein